MLGKTLRSRGIVLAPETEGLMGILLGAAGTALGARIVVPVPGTPVPMTLQVLGVLLAGLCLGGKRGAASQVLCLMAGLVGLPVFASTVGLPALLGPTGGYLLAFPAAAFVAGELSHTLAHRSGRVIAALGAVAVIYLGGWLWLSGLVGAAGGPSLAARLGQAWRLGVAPFIVADGAKGLLAAAIADGGVRLARRDLAGRPDNG